MRTLVCTCDVSGKAIGKAPACSIHDMAESVAEVDTTRDRAVSSIDARYYRMTFDNLIFD